MYDQVHVLDGERAGAIGVVQHATPDTLEVVLYGWPADDPLVLRRDQVEWDDTPAPLPSTWDRLKWVVVILVGLLLLAMALQLGAKMASIFPTETTTTNTSSSAVSTDHPARVL